MTKKKEKGPIFSILPDGTVTSNHWVLNVQEAATALGLEPNSLRQKILPSRKHPFEIQPVRIGKMVRFRLLDIVNCVKNK